MFELVGYREVDMKTENGPLKGHSCFLLNHEEQTGLVGCEAFKVFFSEEKFPDFVPQLNRRYDLRFNQKGKLTGWALIDG